MYDTKPCTSSAGSLQVELLHILFYFFACIDFIRLLFLITDPEPLYIPPEYDNVGNSIKVILYHY